MKVESLHPAHALRGTLRLSFTLTGALFEFHLAETEGQADGDAAAVGLVSGGGLHIRAVVCLTPSVPVEDVVGVEVDRQLAVEEVGTKAGIDAVVGKTLAEEGLRG